MKTIEELRSEFEEVDNIKRLLLSNSLIFIDITNKYQPKFYNETDCFIATFVNGAWFMFQELKK